MAANPNANEGARGQGRRLTNRPPNDKAGYSRVCDCDRGARSNEIDRMRQNDDRNVRADEAKRPIAGRRAPTRPSLVHWVKCDSEATACSNRLLNAAEMSSPTLTW
jgi:hypothetical protein